MLTKKQKSVLDYIKKEVKKNGYSPSLEEIQSHFKLASVSTAHYYIAKLHEEGYVKKNSRRARSMELSEGEFVKSPFAHKMGLDSIAIPVVGSANCGPAVLMAEENIEGYLKISRQILTKDHGIFVVRAEGDSMNRATINDKNIEDGDYVVIDSEDRRPLDGDYVLSVIDGSANLKRFKIDKKKKAIMLISESSNTKHKPIYISSDDDFMINGKIIAVVKK
ncbi:MAG: transcriptional repressor LexA [Candidatus Paceibacterota bacterium]